MISYTPLSGAECPQDLNALLTLFAGHLNLPTSDTTIISSETAPTPSASVLWFRPSTNTIYAYVNGSWRGISGGTWKVGDIIMFDSVVATDTTLASAAHPDRQPWAICDGGTYSGIVTPDFTDRFARGALTSFGAQGGPADGNVILALANVPSHRHMVSRLVMNAGSGSVTDEIDPAGTSSDLTPTSYSAGHGTSFGSETPADPTLNPDPISVLPPFTTIGFKKYIGTP